MISSGSWDYQSMVIQARDNGFEVGVFAFPLPGKDHAVYGKYVDGQPAEQNRSQVSFGLARTSKHPDVALRFLKFLTSKRINEEINAIIGWIPSIRNADVVTSMKPFVPNTEGMPYVWLSMTTIGQRYDKTGTNDAQAYWEYISGDIDFDHYIANIEKRFVVDGMADVIKGLREFEDGIVPMEHSRSFLTAQRVFGRSEEERREAAAKEAGINSTLASRAIDGADQGYRLYRDATTLDNERVRKLVKTAEYGVFLKFFGFEGG
jgi:hypothetical protein